MADAVPTALALAEPDSDAVVLALLLPVGETVGVVVSSAVALVDADSELDDELDTVCVREGGGLPVELVLADPEPDVLAVGERDCAADGETEPVLETVALDE